MHTIENLTFEFWFPCLLSALPILYAILRWGYKIVKKERKKALIFENIESKQYIHKEHDKVELRVLYNKKINYDAIVILKARIKNIGKEDIRKDILVDPIKINSTDNYTIINASVLNPNDKVRPTINYSERSIDLSWDLLKKGKAIDIEVIASIKDFDDKSELALDFYNSLSIDVNADGLDAVDKNVELTKAEQFVRFMKIVIWAYLLITIIMFGYSCYKLPTKLFHNIEFTICADSVSYNSTLGLSHHNNKLCVVDNNGTSKYYSIEEFNQLHSISKINDIQQAKEDAKDNIWSLVWTHLLLIIVIIMMGISVYINSHKIKKRKMLKAN